MKNKTPNVMIKLIMNPKLANLQECSRKIPRPVIVRGHSSYIPGCIITLEKITQAEENDQTLNICCTYPYWILRSVSDNEKSA